MQNQKQDQEALEDDQILKSFLSVNSFNKINVADLLRPDFCQKYFELQIKDSKFSLTKPYQITNSLQKSFYEMLDLSRINCINNLRYLPEEYQNEFYFRRQYQLRDETIEDLQVSLMVYSEETVNSVDVSSTEESEASKYDYPTYPQAKYQYSPREHVDTIIKQFMTSYRQQHVRCLQMINQSYTKNVIFLHDFYHTPIELLKTLLLLHESCISIVAPYIADILKLTEQQQRKIALPYVIDYLARFVRYIFQKQKYCIIAAGTSSPIAIQLQKYDRLCNKIIVCNPIGNIRLDTITKKTRRCEHVTSENKTPDVDVSNRSVSNELGSATGIYLRNYDKIDDIGNQLLFRVQSQQLSYHVDDNSEISETKQPGRRYSATVELKRVGSVENVQDVGETLAPISSPRSNLMNSREARTEVSPRRNPATDSKQKRDVFVRQDIRLLESINNILKLAYTGQVLEMFMCKLGLHSGKLLYPTSDGFARNYGSIYKKHIIQSKRVNHFKQITPSLFIFSPLDNFCFYSQLYDQHFFEMMWALEGICTMDVRVHPLQEIYFFISDHSPLIDQHMLQILHSMNCMAANIEVRCIYGCGHDLYGLVTPFLIQTVKLIFNEA